MVEEYGLNKLMFPEEKHLKPEERDKNTPTIPVFMSHEFQREDKKLNKGKRAMILIHASGSSKVGVWSRESCVKENLAMGTMMPYIDAARKEGVAVLVMNPNPKKEVDSGIPIEHN